MQQKPEQRIQTRPAASDAPHAAPGSATDEDGFTLVEVMVSMVLFLIITGAVYGLLEVARADRSTTSRRVEVAQAARAALNAMMRDGLNAGYRFPVNGALLPDDRIGEFTGAENDGNTDFDVLTPILARNNVNTVDLTSPAKLTDQVTFVFRDPSFGGTAEEMSLASRNESGDRVVLAAAAPVSVQSATPSLYLIACANTGGSTTHAAAIATGTPSPTAIAFGGDEMNLNNSGATTSPFGGTGLTASSLTRLRAVTYLVNAEGTLVRREYGVDAANSNVVAAGGGIDGGKRDTPLAYGIEDMQIEYILADGSKVELPANMNTVRQVIITLSVQSTDADQRLVKPGSDGKARVSLSATISTRNIGYVVEPKVSPTP